MHAQGSVEGKVVSTVGGGAVKRAVVTLKGEETYLVRTDADGRFSLQGVAPGRYEVQAVRDGYQSKPERAVEVTGGANALTVHLVPLALIAGKVVDESGDPVAEATVEAMHYRFTGSNKQLRSNGRATTNDRGEYLLADLAPSRYYLRASSPDQDPPVIGDIVDRGPRRLQVFAAAYYPGTRDPNRASMLEAPPGGELRNVDLQMQRQGVYSISGTSSPGLSVELIRLVNEPRGSYATRRGSSGPFEIWGLVPGPYAVTSKRQGSLYALRRVEIVNDDIRGVDLTSGTSVAVAGRVENAPPGALIVLQSEEATALDISAPLEADGSFHLSAQPDRYVVRIQGSGVYAQSVRIGDRDIPDHRIVPGASTEPLMVVASAAVGRIEGIVTDANGEPAAGVDVTLVPDQRLPYWGDLSLTATSNGSGAFTMPRVIPGDYHLLAVVGGEAGAPLDAEFRRPFEAQGTAVHVAAEGSVVVKLTAVTAAASR
jgi:hypothetical protein